MTDPRIVAELEALDDRRAAATLAKDRATLESVFAPDAVYVHSSATAEDRATFIERATTGWYDYRGLTPLKRQWTVWGDTALCDGEVRIEVVARGNPKDFVSRYLSVWRRGASGWQLVRWHSTLVPQPA